MLERTDLSSLKQENIRNGDNQDAVAADYLIIGSVSEYGRSTKSEVGVFSRNKL